MPAEDVPDRSCSHDDDSNIVGNGSPGAHMIPHMPRIMLVLFLAVVVTRPLVAAPPATQSTTFIRYTENLDGSGRLEVAEATYKNKAGIVVHLIGAVHIADAEFFSGLDESFDHYDALLYEMVKPREAEGVPTTARSTEPSLRVIGGLQRFLR